VRGIRFLIPALIALGLTAPAFAASDGISVFNRKPRLDGSRVRYLAELLRSDPDEKKRRAAVSELGEADPRAYPEVITALIATLKKDAAAVRATAAEVIGKFKTTFPLAGAALESAAESDPDSTVRNAAKQALWDYHLNGYRSAKASETALGQSVEPPFASPGSPRPTLPLAPMPTVVRPVTATVTTQRLPSISAVPVSQQQVLAATTNGPRVRHQLEGLNTPRRFLSLPPRAMLHTEPPIAKRPTKWAPPVVGSTLKEPPILVRRPDLETFGTPPVVLFELPSIVPNPGPNVGGVPLPDPTHEPPVRRVSSR